MKKILVVDDQKEVRELVEVTLRSNAYKIFQASSGELALEIAKKEKPNLVILDVMMPGGIDGLETCVLIKEDIETKNCAIIMLTAKGLADDIDKGLAVGADAYLVKPFSPLELLDKVEAIINNEK